MLSSPVRPVTVVDIVDALERRGGTISTHAVTLRDDVSRTFRLPVGPCEALGIRISLENGFVQRPLTHDLMCAVIEQLGGRLESVLIERHDEEWQATLTIRSSAGSRLIPADHGDAIALALRANAAIFATEDAILST